MEKFERGCRICHASETYHTVIVRSPDTDVFALCLANAIQIPNRLFLATSTSMKGRVRTARTCHPNMDKKFVMQYWASTFSLAVIASTHKRVKERWNHFAWCLIHLVLWTSLDVLVLNGNRVMICLREVRSLTALYGKKRRISTNLDTMFLHCSVVLMNTYPPQSRPSATHCMGIILGSHRQTLSQEADAATQSSCQQMEGENISLKTTLHCPLSLNCQYSDLKVTCSRYMWWLQ